MTTICPACKSEVALDKFCGNCGNLLNKVSDKISQNIKIDGSNNEILQGSAGRDVNINILKTEKSQQNVTYDKVIKKTYTLKQLLLVPGVPSVIAMLLGIYHFIGSSASIASLVNTDNSISAVFSTIISIFALAVSIAFALSTSLWVAFIWFRKRQHIPFIDIFLEKQGNGLIGNVEFTTKCKIEKCNGTLRVKSAPSNDDGVRYIGICNENPLQHRYSFDESLLTGKPINLRPKKEPQQSNN